MSASASRRDSTDGSLARSAWDSVPRKNRPVGYGMIGRRLGSHYFLDFVNSANASVAFSSTASESKPAIGESDFAGSVSVSCRNSTSATVESATSLCTTETSAPGNFDRMKSSNCSRSVYANGTSMIIWNPSNTPRLSNFQERSAMLTVSKNLSRHGISNIRTRRHPSLSIAPAALHDRHLVLLHH